MINITVAIRIWGTQWGGKRIAIKTDYTALYVTEGILETAIELLTPEIFDCGLPYWTLNALWYI